MCWTLSVVQTLIPSFQEFLDVLPTLGVTRPCGVGMGQLVDQDQRRAGGPGPRRGRTRGGSTPGSRPQRVGIASRPFEQRLGLRGGRAARRIPTTTSRPALRDPPGPRRAWRTSCPPPRRTRRRSSAMPRRRGRPLLGPGVLGVRRAGVTGSLGTRVGAGSCQGRLGSRARLRGAAVQVQVEEQDVDPGLAEQAELPPLGVAGGRAVADLVGAHAPGRRDPVGPCTSAALRADVRVQPAARRGHQVDRGRGSLARGPGLAQCLDPRRGRSASRSGLSGPRFDPPEAAAL